MAELLYIKLIILLLRKRLLHANLFKGNSKYLEVEMHWNALAKFIKKDYINWLSSCGEFILK